MEIFTEFLKALFDLSNAMSPYILFGLFFAGILHEIVPESIVKKNLGKNSISSIIKATIFGIPLPVCSCGVIPIATGIKKSGASNGATISFLISTPITGIDSILATYGMFGWAFTIYRIISSIVISIIAGILTNIYAKDANTTDENNYNSENCCSSGSCSSETKKKFSIINALKYSYVTLLKDISNPLLVGVILGAIITIAIPQNLSQLLISYPMLSYVVVLFIAVPMYVCATASLPIAAGLMLGGVSPGAAFVFLSAGPATNTVTMGVVKKILGSKSLHIYLLSIIIGSTVFGFGLDYILKDVDVKSIVHMHEDAGIIEVVSSIVLWSLTLYFVLKPYLVKEKSCCSGGNCRES